MPGHMKAQVFFQSGDFGWSETWWPNVPFGDYTAAQAWANAYVPVRQGLLVKGDLDFPCIVGYRVSDDTIFRDVLVQLYQPPLLGTATGPGESVFTALLIRLVAGPLWRRPLYLRGIPSDIVNDESFYTPTPGWGGLINQLRNFLTSSQGLASVKTTVTSPPATINQIQAIAPPNNFTTVGAHGFIAGQRVIVKGSSRRRNPVGLWTVGPMPGGNTFTLTGVDLPADYVYYPVLSLGVQAKNPDFRPISTIQDERITERKTGRPFGSPRGRRSPHRV